MSELTVPGAVQHSHPVQGPGSNVKRVTRRGVALVERLAAAGHPLVSIAKALRVDQKTLREIRRRQPEVQEAIDCGRGALEVELVDLLLAKARKGDTIAILFALKARCGWREGTVPEGATTTNNVQIIQLPAPMSEDQYREAIAARWRSAKAEEGDGA